MSHSYHHYLLYLSLNASGNVPAPEKAKTQQSVVVEQHITASTNEVPLATHFSISSCDDAEKAPISRTVTEGSNIVPARSWSKPRNLFRFLSRSSTKSRKSHSTTPNSRQVSQTDSTRQKVAGKSSNVELSALNADDIVDYLASDSPTPEAPNVTFAGTLQTVEEENAVGESTPLVGVRRSSDGTKIA